MNSYHVIDHLPLWVEGDLSETEASQVSEHLIRCASCRAAAEALQESQAWLKDSPPPPFDEDDLMKLRRNVFERLTTQQQSPSRLKVMRLYQWAPVMATAAALLLILIAPWTKVQTGSPGADSEKRPSSSSNPRLALTAEVRTPVQASPRATPRPLPIRLPVLSPSKVRGQEFPDETPMTQVRIELQTPNPAIRIIWLPRSPSESPSTPEQSHLS